LLAAETFQDQVFKVLDRDRTEVVFNGSWFGKFSFQDVMRLCGCYTVARMLERDDFAKRMKQEQSIGIHEFLYPLMQAHDSVEVRADVELGGTDQTFNILLGRHLQREAGCPQQVAVVTPLLEGTDGVQKMSKSLGNYIGIAEAPEAIFGKVMSISDELMLRYYELLTQEDLARLQSDLRGGQLHPMDAKKGLAQALVSRFHGSAAAVAAREHFERRFQRRELPEGIETFLWTGDRAATVPLASVLVAAGMVKSMSEARRIIQQGGVRVDGERVRDIHGTLRMDEGEFIVQVGPRRLKKIRCQ
jgi:tyrosyl-tRNA synthetase